jgi:Protein of unknown function (DUF4079)
MSTALPYLHPIAGVAVIVLGAYAASLGLRGRMKRADAERCRARHAALGPWMYACFVGNWLAGFLTLRAWRPDIESAASGHFTVGTAIVLLLTAGFLLSRRIRVDARARAIHPVLGALALLLCGFQVFLGLQLLP